MFSFFQQYAVYNTQFVQDVLNQILLIYIKL